MRRRAALLSGFLLLAVTLWNCSLWRGYALGEHVSFEAPALAGAGNYQVLLPPGYGSTTRTYPVLYFLHDGFGHEKVLWREEIADELYRRMRSGELPEFVIAAPRGDGSFFTNFYDGTRLYEDFIFYDMVREVESRYRCGGSRSRRAITGISMGGYGALKIALKHPQLYSSVSSLSGALDRLTWDNVQATNWFFEHTMERVFGKTADANNLAENDLHNIVAARPELARAGLRIQLRAGTEDRYDLDERARDLAAALEARGVEAELVLEPGVHDWPYWRFAMVELARWHATPWRDAAPR